ncbi:hypothetical protein ACVOMV_09770 [Mesorhizobium atlanticum]
MRGWKRDPVGFWADSGQGDRLAQAAVEKVFDPAQVGLWPLVLSAHPATPRYNAIDRHVAGGRADQLALIHDSAITGTI